MGLYDLAKDALKEIPMSDIMRARLELAVDQATIHEKKVAELQTEVGRLQAKLERADAEKKAQDAELESLREALKEEVRIVETLEFRKGSRTGGTWAPFCPKCHLPARGGIGVGGLVGCSDDDCGFCSLIPAERLNMIIAGIK